MTICELKRGQNATIVQVNAYEKRLCVLGIQTGKSIRLLKISPLRHTYLIESEYAKVALSKEVALCIQVSR